MKINEKTVTCALASVGCHVVEGDPDERAAALVENGGNGNNAPAQGVVAAERREVLRVEHPRMSIRIVLRYGIWQLTRSDRFYGGYVTQQEAFGAARDIADAAAARGEWIDVRLDDGAPSF
jgi:hypothetical protein